MQPIPSSPLDARPPASSRRTFPADDDLRRGILAGLMPLARLVVLLGVALALPAVTRLVTSSQAFGVQQTVAVITFVVGLLLAAGVYAISIVGVYRRMQAWREAGRGVPATAALWTLVVTALVVVAPVVVATALPQHPAP